MIDRWGEREVNCTKVLRKVHFPGIQRKPKSGNAFTILVLRRKCFYRLVLRWEVPLESEVAQWWESLSRLEIESQSCTLVPRARRGYGVRPFVEHIGIIISNGNSDIVTTSVCLNVSVTPEEGRLNQPVDIFLYKAVKYSQQVEWTLIVLQLLAQCVRVTTLQPIQTLWRTVEDVFFPPGLCRVHCWLRHSLIQIEMSD